MRGTVLAIAVAAALPSAAGAQSAGLEVSAPWARASLGTARPGAMYVTLTNTGDRAVTLTGIETGVAEMPEIHRSVTAEGQSRMVPAGPLEIGPGETVGLAPGGLHVMLMGPSRAIEEGDSFEATLLFEAAEPVTVTVPVRSLAAQGPDG